MNGQADQFLNVGQFIGVPLRWRHLAYFRPRMILVVDGEDRPLMAFARRTLFSIGTTTVLWRQFAGEIQIQRPGNPVLRWWPFGHRWFDLRDIVVLCDVHGCPLLSTSDDSNYLDIGIVGNGIECRYQRKKQNGRRHSILSNKDGDLITRRHGQSTITVLRAVESLSELLAMFSLFTLAED